MGLKRDEFRDQLAFGPGEDYLGAWHVEEQAMDAQGRVAIPAFQADPETWRRELVLSNYRVRYAGQAGVELEIPLTAISEARLVPHPVRRQYVLSLLVYAIMEEQGPRGTSRDFPGWRHVGFLVDERDNAAELLQRVRMASELAGQQFDSLPGQPEYPGGYEPGPEEDRPPQEPTGTSARRARRSGPDDPDSPIRFHAEQDP